MDDETPVKWYEFDFLGKPFNSYIPMLLKVGFAIGLIAGAAIIRRG